jgi:hypothetical protein
MRGRGPALLLLLLALLPGQAQSAGLQPAEACRAPQLVPPEPPALEPFEPGGSQRITFAIESRNEATVETVEAVVTTKEPAGWRTTIAPREVTLSSATPFSLTSLEITAPNRGSGAAAGNITLLVTFVCTSGDIATTRSTTRVIEVELKGFEAPWPLVLGGFLVLLAGVAILGVRRLRRGVALSAAAPDRTVEAGKSVKFTFLVENRRGKPQRFAVIALGVPEGWSVHLALEDLALEPGEEKTLWAILKAPATALPGTEADVQLRLESPKAPRESVATRVRVKVVAS